MENTGRAAKSSDPSCGSCSQVCLLWVLAWLCQLMQTDAELHIMGGQINIAATFPGQGAWAQYQKSAFITMRSLAS